MTPALPPKAPVAKLVYAADLGSAGGFPPCGFESRRGHLRYLALNVMF